MDFSHSLFASESMFLPLPLIFCCYFKLFFSLSGRLLDRETYLACFLGMLCMIDFL